MAAFPAQESQLAGLRKTVEEICLQANLSSKEINNIVLAIEEGATNIIRHAYMFSEGEIRLKVEVFKHSIVFSLFDNGKSFQPPDKSKLDLKKMAATGRKGGLGFYLLNKVMDRVEYFSLEGENELRMTKFLSDRGEKELEWGGGLSLRVKFSAFTFLIVVVLVIGAYLYINSRSSQYIQSQLEDTVKALSSTITSQASGFIINQRSDAEFDELVVSYQRANEIIQAVIIVDTNGVIIADSRGPTRLYTRLENRLLSLIDRTSDKKIFPFEEGQQVIVGQINLGGSNLGAIVLEYSSLVMEAELKDAREIILIITALGLLIGITGIYLLSNYFVRPIGRIVYRVRKFAEGDLESQLPLKGAGEFYEISKALNELIMRMRRDRKNIIEREIMQKEMQMAEEIQKALIPTQLPSIEGYDFGAIYKSARMVGGDLFDFVEISDHTFGVVVADVSGKGIPGSLVMSMVRTALRLEARSSKSARDVLIKVNDYVSGNIKSGIFVTILLAIVNTKSGKINFASAGHNPLLHFNSALGEASFINAGGMPVGLKPGRHKFAEAIKSAELKLKENDFLVIYTDGVTEERGRSNKAYGTERIVEILKENHSDSAEKIARLFESDIARFVGKNDQHDDITMVILKKCSQAGCSNETRTDKKESVPQDIKIDSVTIKPKSTPKK
ncbi:MAG: SpoIIE family protein phosphatase [candidate division Zixibacteria bacterium]